MLSKIQLFLFWALLSHLLATESLCCYLLSDFIIFVIASQAAKQNGSILSQTLCLSVRCTARVAVVKSRDMHWSLLAQRDQRDISLSSLRMLIVADGANPCESICRFSNTLKSQEIIIDFYFVWICLFDGVCLCVSAHYHRVDIIVRCLPQCVPGTWAATWSDLSMCQLFRSHDCRHPQVSCRYCIVSVQSAVISHFGIEAGSCRERRMTCASITQGQKPQFRAFRAFNWSAQL